MKGKTVISYGVDDMAGVVIPNNPDRVTFGDGEKLLPEWQRAFLDPALNLRDLTYQEWVSRYVNPRLLQSYLHSVAPALFKPPQ